MPRRNAHIVVGASAAILGDLFLQWIEAGGESEFRLDLGRLLIAGGIGAVAGVVPDILEPATSPNHRGFFHSATSGYAVWWACKGQHTEALDPNVRAILQAIAVGFGSHLAADSITPRSIRLV